MLPVADSNGWRPPIGRLAADRARTLTDNQRSWEKIQNKAQENKR
jgi:hypothetical protein